MREIIGRYPRARSALMPMLHLVQAEEGYVSPAGIEMCAEELGLSTAEVAAVTTFYSMYKRRPVGAYHVGVCTNTLCAIMGGDAVFAALQEHLGIGHNEATADGTVSIEHVECNAACDYAPVVMVNWEFFDNQTPESARQLVDELRAGTPPRPTRGAPLCTFREASRILAGFPDPRRSAVAARSTGPATLAGTLLARERDEAAPPPRKDDEPAKGDGAGAGAAEQVARTAEGGARSASAHDAPVQTAESDPANPAAPKAGGGSETDAGADATRRDPRGKRGG